MTLNAQKGHHTCFFAGFAFRNYRSFRSGQLLEMLSQAATQTPLVIEQKKLWKVKAMAVPVLSGSNSQWINPKFPFKG